METDSIVKEWVDFAKMDWMTARHLYESFFPRPREIICFHCQQSIEKMLKGLLIFLGQPLQKTHDLTMLINFLPDDFTMPHDYQKICAKLTVYATATRYPSEYRLTEEEVDSAIRDTAKVFSWIEACINCEMKE